MLMNHARALIALAEIACAEDTIDDLLVLGSPREDGEEATVVLVHAYDSAKREHRAVYITDEGGDAREIDLSFEDPGLAWTEFVTLASRIRSGYVPAQV